MAFHKLKLHSILIKTVLLHVNAKDLGTQKEQNITIQVFSGLSDDEIERMVKDAEANAEADKNVKKKQT